VFTRNFGLERAACASYPNFLFRDLGKSCDVSQYH